MKDVVADLHIAEDPVQERPHHWSPLAKLAMPNLSNVPFRKSIDTGISADENSVMVALSSKPINGLCPIFSDTMMYEVMRFNQSESWRYPIPQVLEGLLYFYKRI
jgi:hypothetical protein